MIGIDGKSVFVIRKDYFAIERIQENIRFFDIHFSVLFYDNLLSQNSVKYVIKHPILRHLKFLLLYYIFLDSVKKNLVLLF